MQYNDYDRGHLDEGYDNDHYGDDGGAFDSPISNPPSERDHLVPTYHGDGALFGKIRDYTMAIRLRHSPIYFGFNIFILVLTTMLVAWVVFSDNHTPRGRLFFFVETLVTMAVVLDLAVEVSYYGGEAYFTGRGTSRGVDDYSMVRCLSHWFQLVVTVLCVIALLLYFFVPSETGHAAVVAANKMNTPTGWHASVDAKATFGPADEDNFVSLFLLLVRYLVYVVFILTSSTRTMQLQGCCDRNKEWDIKLEYEDARDSWISDGE